MGAIISHIYRRNTRYTWKQSTNPNPNHKSLLICKDTCAMNGKG
jgi:hypothetical protein